MNGILALCFALSLFNTQETYYPPEWYGNGEDVVVELHALKSWPWKGSYTVIHNDRERDKLCSPWVINALLTEEITNARNDNKHPDK